MKEKARRILIELKEKNKALSEAFDEYVKSLSDELEIPKDIAELIKDKCEKTLKEIEQYEPWNERLKQNVKAYYEYYLNPGEYTSISKAELEHLKELGLDKIVFDWQAVDEEIDNDLMGRKRTNTYDAMTSIIRPRNAGLNVDVHFIPMKQNYKDFK